MANIFLNIPVPAANGAGAPVDVSAMGKTKSIVCGGVFSATVNLEFANDVAALVWAPLATFHQSGNLTIDIAARWIRANVSAYKSGAANVDVGCSDAGSLFAMLPGGGAPVGISAMPLFKTVVAPSSFAGNIEVSEDGIAWAQIFSMQDGGSQSRDVVGQFARVNGGSGEDVWIGATSEGGSGGASTIVVQDEGVPLGSFTTVNFIGAGVTAADAGGGVASVTVPGGGAASRLLSIYGDGSFGDHATAGDETWTTLAGAPGAPVIPPAAPFSFAFFNNLTISPGNSVAVGSDTDSAVVIFVKETLTIGAGGRIHANGFDAPVGGLNPFGNPGGAGRKAIIGSVDGGAGGAGGGTLVGDAGQPGGSGASRPAQVSAVMIGGAGGDTDFQLTHVVGGPGGTCLPDPSWPYSLSQAISIASLVSAIGGGNGGGGGAGAGAGGFGGGGGGGGGTLVIFAKNVVFADPGCIQAKGGAGWTGASSENIPGAGGGGGTGGTIVIVTENTTLAGATDVSGGAGGAGVGFPQSPGFPGGPGEVIAFNPMLAARIAA